MDKHKHDLPDIRKMADEKFYKIMAENLGEEIFVTDGEGKILFVNPASAKSVGLPVDEIIGKNAQDLVEEGCFTKSVTMEVIHTGKQANCIQT
ncbi:MAG: PAS domain S-box protein, partial [Anaerovoracaceae bacterium]